MSACLPGSSAPWLSPRPDGQGGVRGRCHQRLLGRHAQLEAGKAQDQPKVGRGRCAGVEVGAQRDRDAALDEPAGGRVVVAHQVQRGRRQERRDHGRARVRRSSQGLDARLGDRGEMVGAGGTQLGGERGTARVVQLVGVEARAQAQALAREQDAPRLAGIEHAQLAEDVAEARHALLRHARQLPLDHVGHVSLGGIGPAAQLARHGVRAEERRHQLKGAFPVERPGHREQPQLACRRRGRSPT